LVKTALKLGILLHLPLQFFDRLLLHITIGIDGLVFQDSYHTYRSYDITTQNITKAEDSPTPTSMARLPAFNSQRLDYRFVEPGQVSRLTRSDQIPILNNGFVNPFRPSISQVYRYRGPGGNTASPKNVG